MAARSTAIGFGHKNQANPAPTTARPRIHAVSFAQLVVMTLVSRFENSYEVEAVNTLADDQR